MMLQEVTHTRQIPDEPFRRWFRDSVFDLIIWYSPECTVIGFQLCYRNWSEEKALTWLKGEGFSHSRIDDGEARPDRHKMTPILIPDGVFDVEAVAARFEKAGAQIDPQIVDLVLRALHHYPDGSFEG